MGDEQQPGSVELTPQVAVVESGDDRLARPGSCDNEIVGMTAAALDLEAFEDLALERVRLDLKRREDRVAGLGYCRSLSEALGVERLEVRVGPVRGEGTIEGGDQLGVVTPAYQDGDMTDAGAGGASVWALLVERDLMVGGDLRLFWTQDAAEAAARDYLAEVWLDGSELPSGVDDVIEQHNGDPATGEHIYLGPVVIEGERARCEVCGEPTVLDDGTEPPTRS